MTETKEGKCRYYIDCMLTYLCLQTSSLFSFLSCSFMELICSVFNALIKKKFEQLKQVLNYFVSS